MFKLRKSQTQRGSIEVVILVVVVAAIIGLVAWRIAETQKTQLDTQAAVDTIDTTAQQNNKVAVSALNMQFTIPENQGRFSLTNQKAGDMPSSDIVSQKLRDAESTCEGENTGVFGTLSAVNDAEGAPQPQYTKDVDGTLVGFTSKLEKNCYSEELMKAFRETVPQAIIESLESTGAPEAATPKEE